MNVIARDPFVSPERAQMLGVEVVDSLDELLERADFLSTLTVLNADTKHMIGEAQLRKMKPTARVINTGRGELIDNVALEGRRSYDLAQSPVLIRLGNAEERFRVELMDEAEADRRLAALPPIDVHRLPGVPSPADDPTPMANPTLPPVSRPGSW